MMMKDGFLGMHEMFKEKNEEIEFVTNQNRNKFIKEVSEALEQNKPLSKKRFLLN